MAEKLEKLGAAPIIVPSDGNCLVWSCLISMDVSHAVFDRDCKSKTSQGEQVEVRKGLKQLWLDHQNDPTWQLLLRFLAQDTSEMATPPKKAKQNQLGLDSTPPRPEDPNPKRARVGECRPVPSLAPQEKESITLRPPCSTAAPAFLEPQIPDLAEAIEADFDKEKQKMEFVDFADDKENPEEDKFKKSSHSRCCRSRTMSENEKKNENLAAWFAHKGVTYQVWLSAHRDNRTVKKAWSCEHSGWKKMLQHVAAGKELTCQVPLL
jgi:hypothetical protein